MRVILAIGGAIAALVLLVVTLSVLHLREREPSEADVETEVDVTGRTAVDSLARIQAAELEEHILKLEEQVAALNEEVLALRVELQRVGAPGPETPLEPGVEAPRDGIGPGIDDYAGVVLIPDRLNVNDGLTVATPTFLEEALGRPRERLSDRCEAMENAKLLALLQPGEVGPIQVRMLEPAIESARRVFEKIRQMDSDLYDRINTAGSLCVRQIRGSVGRVSGHAFGLALDINVDGQLDVLGDGRTQLGLLLISDLFREEGWIWGAGFSREDSMHFEVSRELIEDWRKEGRI